jgi:7-cyano-7-deazaguanine synthase in queuosine biosynthesis
MDAVTSTPGLIPAESCLLYSGGVDSYCCALLTQPEVLLYAKMAGRYGTAEFARLKIPPGMEDRFVSIDLRQLGEWELSNSKVIPGRNAMLALAGANYADEIQMASVDSSTGNDKDPEFVGRLNHMFEYIFAPQRWLPNGRHVRMTLPVYHLTKAELVGECLRQGYDGQEISDRTFSCYEPHRNKECGQCAPCGRKWAAFTVWGIDVGFDGRNAIRHYVEEIKDGPPPYRSTRFCLDILDAWNGEVRMLQ